MQEHKEKETEKKEKKVRRAKKTGGEKRFYTWTAISCAAVLAAIIIIAVAVTGKEPDNVQNQVDNTPSVEQPDNTPPTDDEQVSGLPEGMISPMQSVSVSHDYGFYHNETLNCYYEHQGVDFAAEAGANVLAVEDGVVESVYKDDLLVGTQITVDHGDGVKSVYCFVTEAEGLKAGDSVKKGDVIATVAEPSGSEYKQGAHLHFEMVKNGTNVDPSVYLTLEEK